MVEEGISDVGTLDGMPTDRHVFQNEIAVEISYRPDRTFEVGEHNSRTNEWLLCCFFDDGAPYRLCLCKAKNWDGQENSHQQDGK